MKWLEKSRRRAKRTALNETSEVFIDDGLTLEGSADAVVLSILDRAKNRCWRSRWSRDEVSRIHAALGLWLLTGTLMPEDGKLREEC